MTPNEIEQFIALWNQEADKTVRLLRTLPRHQYDFRPDAGGRSLGELAWHLAEGDAYMTFSMERGAFARDARPPGIERPRTVEELAPGYERVHTDALARVRKLQPADLDKSLTFFNGQPVAIRDILWNFVLLHGIHHRGQLVLMCRLAGGQPIGVFGPTREEMPAPPAKAAAAAN